MGDVSSPVVPHATAHTVSYGGEWPASPEDYGLACFTVVACMAIVLAVLSALSGYALRTLEERHAPRFVNREDFRGQLALLLWARMQQNLAVIGLLAAATWLANRFDLAKVYSSFPIHKWALALFGDGTEYFWMRCRPRLPPDQNSFLHLVGDVLLHLVLSMTLAFGFLWIALRVELSWLSTYEQLECGTIPKDPVERAAVRRLAAMRAQLLAAVRTVPSLASAVAAAESLKEDVARGELYVSGYVAESILTHVRLLVDFAPSTWLLVALYFSMLAASLAACAGGFRLQMWTDGLWYVSSIYLAWRVLLHSTTLRQGAGRPWRWTTWPAGWLDRLLFPLVGPGVAGWVPFMAQPSGLVSVRCLQAMLWLQLYSLGKIATDPFLWAAHEAGTPAAPHPFSETMGWIGRLGTHPFAAIVVPRAVCLYLWSVWIAPGLIEILSLPPYLTANRHHPLLLHVLRTYPHGRPADVAPPTAVALGAMSRSVRREKPGTSYLERAFAAWRALWGVVDPIDRAQRLADHAAWIEAGGGQVGVATGRAASAGAGGAATRAPLLAGGDEGRTDSCNPLQLL